MSEETSRIHYLDWLRVLVIGGVFVVHAMLPFSGVPWLINTDQTIVSAAFVSLLGNQFGMPLLFLISGAATWFSLRKRPAGPFIRERFMRLMVPYALFVMILSPIQAFYSAQQNGSYDGNFIGYLPHFFSLERYQCCDLRWAGAYGYHLWFLVFLFAFALITLPLCLMIKQERIPWLTTIVYDVCSAPGGILLLTLPIAVSQILLRAQFAAYQGWADFAFWGFFYFYGFLFFSNEHLQRRLEHAWRAGLTGVIVSLVALIFVAVRTFIAFRDLITLADVGEFLVNPGQILNGGTAPDITFVLYILVFSLLSLFTWSMIILIMGVGRRFMNVTHPVFVYISEISLPFYIIHHPVIVVLGFYIIRLYIGADPSLILLQVSALVITMGSIELVVRPMNTLRTAVGMRQLPPERRLSLRRLAVYQAVFVVMVVAYGGMLHTLEQNPYPSTFNLLARETPIRGWQVIDGGRTTTCSDGSPYRFLYHQSQPNRTSRTILIYFAYGGTCWTAESCGPNSLTYERTTTGTEANTLKGIFDFTNDGNPLANHDVILIPSCTGDMHIGSATTTYTDLLDNTLTIEHQGAANARYALEWVYRRYPLPRQVILAGGGTGAVGAIYHTPGVIDYYGEEAVMQIGDSFTGVIPEAWTGFATWNVLAGLPETIAESIGETPDTFVNDLYSSIATAYPNASFSQTSRRADSQQVIFYTLAGGNSVTWTDEMITRIAELEDRLPNFRAYLDNGVDHQFLTTNTFYTSTVNGIRLRDWFTGLVNGREVPNAH